MSGGAFNYSNYVLHDIATEIEELIATNNKKDDWGEKRGYKNKTLKEFEKAVKYLKLAEIYVHRIDWLVSCDDGEDTFHERLKEELEKIK